MFLDTLCVGCVHLTAFSRGIPPFRPHNLHEGKPFHVILDTILAAFIIAVLQLAAIAVLPLLSRCITFLPLFNRCFHAALIFPID
jgi:hypothetical protein